MAFSPIYGPVWLSSNNLYHVSLIFELSRVKSYMSSLCTDPLGPPPSRPIPK